RGSVIEPPLPAAEISLTDHNGTPFRLSDHRGKVVALFFGYASCPDVCPATMAVLKQSRAQLKPDQAARVQVVFITVDPNRDAPELIQEYVSRFDPTFIGLSGTEAELSPVWQAYGVFRELGEPNASGFYDVSHTARVYVVDAQGNLSLSFPFGATVEDVVHDLKILLK
ncbi:MAG: SCO family protein, partial [Chloroflexota bacterium]